jgi:hypothetical protein
MRSAAPRPGLVLALVVALGACNSSSEPCQVETLHVRMPATVVRNGQSATDELSYEVTVGQTSSVAAFEATRTFLTDAAHYTGTIAWTISSSAVPLALALQLQGPRQAGEVLPVSPGVFADWGPIAPPNGAFAAAAVSADNFTASANTGDGSVSGTLEVLEVAPLQLRLDLVATSAADEEIRIQGDMAAQHSGNALGCD